MAFTGRGSTWKSRSGKGGRSNFWSTGNDMYAPAQSSSGERPHKEMEKVGAVGEREHFHLDFMRGYPDSKLNCVKDYGIGPERLQPPNINSHTSGKNAEWKRRLDFATSFTAASMRVLERIASDVPRELGDLIGHGAGNGLLPSLVLLRKVLVDSEHGRQFMSACNFLDTSNEVERNHDELEMHVKKFFVFLATNNEYRTCMQLMTMHGAALFTGGGWGVQAASLPLDMQAWAEGFPASQDIRKFYTDEVRAWLRDPSDVGALIQAVVSSYVQRFGQSETKSVKKADWNSLTPSGFDRPLLETRKEAKRAPPSWSEFEASDNRPSKKPKVTWTTIAAQKETRRDALPELEPSESEAEQDDANVIYAVWAQGDAQVFAGWVEDAKQKVGIKGEAKGIAEYVEQLESVPDLIRAKFGLGNSVEQLRQKKQPPRNIKAYLERMTDMATDVLAFHESQQRIGSGGSGGAAAKTSSWDNLIPASQPQASQK